MNWTDVGEIIKALGPAFTAAAAWFAAVIGYRGLTKWRQETIGKRKFEIAEEVLADFYEAREIITFARFRGYSREEGASRPTEIWETESDFRALNAYFVPAERLAKKSEFFARFQAHRYRFLALFGAELTKPFDEMIKIRSEILSAVEMLIANYRHPDLELVPGDRQEALAIIGRAKDDPIAGRLDNAVEAIERTCRPVTQEIAR